MNAADLDTHVLLRAFTDELVRSGVRHACTSPGSRSTPLVLALVRDGRLQTHSHIDERAAAFFALGLAKATGEPVAIACTSGTAAANFLPAVVEAHEAGIPLLVLTADRPPELREVGAGQAIDQLKLYGSAVRWFFDVGTHDASAEPWMRALACRAVHATLGADGRPGPVHLNFPLREPLVAPTELPAGLGGRADGEPWLLRRDSPAVPGEEQLARYAGWIAANPRGVVVAGRAEREQPALGEALARFATAAGWPLLADPLSWARRGAAAVAHYDALLRCEPFAAAQRPSGVLRAGDLPTSKPLRAWLAALDAEQVAFDPEGVWHDPDATLWTVLGADPAGTLDALAERVQPGDPSWLETWTQADAAAAAAIDEELAEHLGEPRVARELGALLPGAATLFVASSMPVRDVETFFAARADPPRVLAHRGANGIDGTVSAAFGAAAAGGGPVALLIGDVALAHDLGGLLAATRLGLVLTIVLIDNAGGGIFDFLPVAAAADAFEEHVATPTGLDARRIAELFELGYVAPENPAEFADAVSAALIAPRTSLIHVRSDRKANVAEHRAVWDRVARIYVQ
ncbi:MAG: 2-succinyl-5-enolpyruvyl-6-hydroxy-3-cyclohexene-carboxylate synthase [Solirubrobacteraceae bacterium]|nr:2-succinyl-5-enolpyruvyl-6-hydroxy-3-cyclohexene-carboxylate synthase [Solirubrobacteraceae bacterium]